MKLTFIGVRPSKPLEQMLLANGFELACFKSVPKGFSAKKTNLIAVAAHSKFHDQLEKWREQSPHVWIAVVVEKPWFTETKKINSLIQCEEKNDVWVKDVWEQMFWFSLQKYFQHRGVQAQLAAAREENKAMKGQYRDLDARSKSLVEKLEKDVGLATNIQRSLLPKVTPEIPGIAVAVKYIPSHGLGGDYYDIFEFGDRKRFGVILADSKSHGLAATLLSVLLKVRLDEVKDRFPDSKSFLEHISQEMQEVHKKDMPPMSLFYGILDRSSLHLQFTAAGDISPVVWRNGNALKVHLPKNPPLGGTESVSFEEGSVDLMPGDLLILHTDGLLAPLSRKGKKPEDTLVDILNAQPATPDPLVVRNELLALVDSHIEDTPLEDDLTLIQLAIHDRALYVAKDNYGK